MCLFLVLTASFLFTPLVASPPCTASAPGETYDLSPIRGSLPATSEDGFTYRLGICGDVTPPPGCPSTSSVAFQYKHDACQAIGGPSEQGTAEVGKVRPPAITV